MDFFAWQAKKQGVDKDKKCEPNPSDIVEFNAERQEPIEVRELTASTAAIKRLRQSLTDKRG